MSNLSVPLALLLVAGGWLGGRKRDSSWTERLTLALLPALLGILLFAYHHTVILNTHWGWSACRLAPTIGMFHGYPLYSPADHGPINGWLYGPVAALFWAPAALARSPQPALVIAAVIDLCFLLAPLGLVISQTPATRSTAGWLAFVFGAAALLQIYPTWYMASALNADAIAVGLGAGACLLLLGERGAEGKRLLASASLSVLAVWSKQTEAPLVIAQIAWLGFVHGRATVLKFCAACAGAMAVMFALIFALFDPAAVIFNMWTVPSAHARPGGWLAAWNELVDFCHYTWILWLPGALALFLTSTGEAVRPGVPPAAWRGPLLFAAAAVALFPLGAMAAIKVGGDRNSIHSVYYLILAATLALARAGAAADGRRAVLIRRALLAGAVTLAILVARQVDNYSRLPMLPPRCLSQEAWLFARSRPGQIYFPWDPLATLMAEGRMYDFEYGVLDRIYAGRAPSVGRIRPDLPARLSVVIYPKAGYAQTMLKDYLRGFTIASATDDWLIYRAPDAIRPVSAGVGSPLH